MATIIICSDFGAPQNKVSHCFHCFPIYLPWSDGTRCHDFWMLSFKPTLSLSSFTFIKRLYSSSSLSAIIDSSSGNLHCDTNIVKFWVVLLTSFKGNTSNWHMKSITSPYIERCHWRHFWWHFFHFLSGITPVRIYF